MGKTTHTKTKKSIKSNKKIVDSESDTESTSSVESVKTKVSQKKPVACKKFFVQESDSAAPEQTSIILHLPIYDDTTENENTNVADETSEVSETENEDKEKNLIVYLSDENEEEEDISYLKKELKKKNTVIKKLQDEVNTRSEHVADSTSINRVMNINRLSTCVVRNEKTNKIPIAEKTNIACWWCAHNFDNVPCYIPEKYYNEKYYVFGCFCSYNCALAYTLKDDEYKMAIRISLIKRLYSELYETKELLYASPPKEILQKFGGTMTIEEYRKNSQLRESKNKLNVLIPSLYIFS